MSSKKPEAPRCADCAIDRGSLQEKQTNRLFGANVGELIRRITSTCRNQVHLPRHPDAHDTVAQLARMRRPKPNRLWRILLAALFSREVFLGCLTTPVSMLDVIRAALSRRMGTQENISAIFKIKFATANEQDCALTLSQSRIVYSGN